MNAEIGLIIVVILYVLSIPAFYFCGYRNGCKAGIKAAKRAISRSLLNDWKDWKRMVNRAEFISKIKKKDDG